MNVQTESSVNQARLIVFTPTPVSKARFIAQCFESQRVGRNSSDTDFRYRLGAPQNSLYLKFIFKRCAR